MSMQGKGGRNRARTSLDRAPQIFSTPTLWHQKAPSQGTGDDHSSLHLEQALPSAPQPTLPRLTYGGSTTAQDLNSTRSTTRVHVDGPLSGPQSEGSEALPSLILRHSAPLTGASQAPTARGSLDMSTRPHQSHPSVFCASPHSSAAGSLGAHSRGLSNLSPQQLQPTPPGAPHLQRIRSRSTPRLRSSLDAALSHPPFHQHHIPPRPPRHPLLSPTRDHQTHQQQQHHNHFNNLDHQHQHHHQQQSFNTPIASSSSAGPLQKWNARKSTDQRWPLEDSDPGIPHRERQSASIPIAIPPSTGPLCKRRTNRSVDFRWPQEDSDPGTPQSKRQSGSTPSSSAGPLHKLKSHRSMDYRWTQEADPSLYLCELERQALKELEELRKLRESRQPEHHDDPALRPASPTLYAPAEDSSLRIPKHRLPPTLAVEPRGQSCTQTRGSSCLSLCGVDDEELSAQASHLSRASTRSRLGAEASAGSGSNHNPDAPSSQDILASSLYRLTAHHLSLPPTPQKPVHLRDQVQELQPLQGQAGWPPLWHASNPHPLLQQQQQQQQQQRHPRTLHSTTASNPPNGPHEAAPPGTNSPLRPTPRRHASVCNIPCDRTSKDAIHHRTSSPSGTCYNGTPLAADMAPALPHVSALGLCSSGETGKTAHASEPCTQNQANQVPSEPLLADSSGGGSFGSRGSYQQQQQQQQQHGFASFQHPHPLPPQQQQQNIPSLGVSPAKRAPSPRAGPATPRDALSSSGMQPKDEQPASTPAVASHSPQLPLQTCAPHPPPQPAPQPPTSVGERCMIQGPQPHPPTSVGEKYMTQGPQPHPPTSPNPSLVVIPPELVCQEGDELQAPDMPSPSDWSKMAAGAADRRHKVNIDKGGRWHPRVSETNPIAFDGKAARSAEADYRAAAGHAHECIQGLSSAGASDTKASTHFLGAVHDLQAHRPYFVPPVQRREAVSRAPFKEDSPPPDDNEHSDREQQAAGPQEWMLQNSIFANRDFDSPEVLAQQFAKDWQRLASKPRLRKIVLRLLPAGATDADLEQELAKIRAVFATHHVVTRAAFLYYSCLGVSVGLDSMMVLHLPDFHVFTRECNIADPKAPGAKPPELETAFIAANFNEGTEVTELKRRCAVDGILRVPSATSSGSKQAEAVTPPNTFEFMELLIRVSISKFQVPKVTVQLSDAVSKLFEEHLKPHLPEAAQTPADSFRHRFYTQEVEAEVLQYWDLLQAVFKVYKAKDCTKLFWPDHWLALLTDLNLLGPHTGIDKACAKVLAGMSQMTAADELKIRQRAVSLSFLDLLEALGRLSEVLSPPCLAEMVGTEGGTHMQSVPAQQQQHQQQQTSSSGSGAASVQAVSEQKGAFMGFSCSVAEHTNNVQAGTDLATRHAALSGMGGRLHKSAQQRPLIESFRPLLKLLNAGIQAKWGEAKPGASKWEVDVAKSQTVSRMLKVAQEVSGGIELNR